jgi:hypothetical protein
MTKVVLPAARDIHTAHRVDHNRPRGRFSAVEYSARDALVLWNGHYIIGIIGNIGICMPGNMRFHQSRAIPII